MRYKTLTAKLPEDLFADLEAYALQEFPDNCRKCQGAGEVGGTTCQHCGGSGIKGNLSEATRYLMHFGLGESAGPEARAMAAAYADFRSQMFESLSHMIHRLEDEFHKQVVEAMRELSVRS